MQEGGPAFPQPLRRFDTQHEAETFNEWGLSKREWFAGMALQGIASGKYDFKDTKEMAQSAYRMADAMLQAWQGTP